MHWLIQSRLHDFGFRGCTCVEQSIIGGTAHLINFDGTDTMSAAYYATFHLNEGRPIGESIPATEHSVMTSWKNEKEAIINMINKFGGENKLYACVMDSYDYQNALDNVLGEVLKLKNEKGGIMVLRPDSGEPRDVVLMALRAAEKHNSAVTNSLGFKVLNGFAVIQGDGVNYSSIKEITSEFLKAGYAASNVAFGMGGGLLQKVNRDTMSFATKLNFIKYEESGEERNVMKKPLTEAGKISFPGILKVKRVNGIPTIFPAKSSDPIDPENLMKVVWDKGPVKDLKWENFDEIRKRVNDEWHKVPKTYNPISKELQEQVDIWVADFNVKFPKKNK